MQYILEVQYYISILAATNISPPFSVIPLCLCMNLVYGVMWVLFRSHGFIHFDLAFL